LNTIIETSIQIGLIPALDTFLSFQICYVCKRIEESKDDFTKKRIKKLKRVKDIIKHKGCQKSARIKKMLKNARFS